MFTQGRTLLYDFRCWKGDVKVEFLAFSSSVKRISDVQHAAGCVCAIPKGMDQMAEVGTPVQACLTEEQVVPHTEGRWVVVEERRWERRRWGRDVYGQHLEQGLAVQGLESPPSTTSSSSTTSARRSSIPLIGMKDSNDVTGHFVESRPGMGRRWPRWCDKRWIACRRSSTSVLLS